MVSVQRRTHERRRFIRRSSDVLYIVGILSGGFMREKFKASIEVDAEWLRWQSRDDAQLVLLREINRIMDPWFRKIEFENATSVRVRQVEE